MRFTDIDIRADTIQQQPAAALEPPSVPSRAEQVQDGTGRGLLLGLLLLFALVGAWVAWLRGRRNQLPSPAISPALGFSCAACGKHLKTRAELAGKKVKCPQCGQAVLVPEPGRATPTAIPEKLRFPLSRVIVFFAAGAD